MLAVNGGDAKILRLIYYLEMRVVKKKCTRSLGHSGRGQMEAALHGVRSGAVRYDAGETGPQN